MNDCDAAITVEDVREWSAIDDLSDDDVQRIIRAIPDSTIPESIANIAFAIRCERDHP
ncbi:hypothetical protein SEA_WILLIAMBOONE_183 [Gordonia phage WilliamBoone]|nr:hypothetical protein SEA_WILLIAMBOONE_183 [Gordonia phage WilliamBoone]